MAITIKNFAALVVFFQYRVSSGNMLDSYDIEQLTKIVEDMVKPDPHADEATRIDLVPLFNAIVLGKKIEAIKIHRMLTSFGLKESKDEIERLMHSVQPSTYLLINNIKAALNTEENDNNLVSVARNAHEAELRLHRLSTDAKSNSMTEDQLMQELINY